MTKQCDHAEIKLPYDRVRAALEIAENGPGTCAAIPVLYADGCIGDVIIERPKKGDKTITAAVVEEREAILKIAIEENRPSYEKGTDWGDGYIAAMEFMIRQIRARGEEAKKK
jgi:hypothetical protein